MPRKISFRRKVSKRKTYRKKRRFVARKRRFGRNVIVRSVNPAKQMPSIWKLRYNETVNVSTTSSGTTDWYAFSANSIYDPNVTGAGHQPMMHDQLADFWEKYVVIGSKITVRCTADQAGALAGTQQYVGIIVDDNNTLINPSPSAIIENAKGTYKLMQQGPYTARNATTLSAKFSARKFFNVRNVKDNDQIGSSFGNNPANQAYFLIWTASNFSSFASTAVCDVTIDYIIACQEPKDLQQS